MGCSKGKERGTEKEPLVVELKNMRRKALPHARWGGCPTHSFMIMNPAWGIFPN